MIPVTVTIESINAREAERLREELRAELCALGIDGLDIDVGDHGCQAGSASTVTCTGLLHLAKVPMDERRRRVETTARAAIQAAGLDPAMAVEIDTGWGQLRTTDILPDGLTTELDATIAAAKAQNGGLAGVERGEITTLVTAVSNDRPSVAVEHNISQPMFNRLVWQRLQERRAE